TAHALFTEGTATPARMCRFAAGSPGLGLSTCVHLRPFQCRIRVLASVPSEPRPTAQALVADDAPALSSASAKSGLGLANRFHLLPSQCSMRVELSVPSLNVPTAHALSRAVAAIPVSMTSLPGSGLLTRAHLVPF